MPTGAHFAGCERGVGEPADETRARRARERNAVVVGDGGGVDVGNGFAEDVTRHRPYRQDSDVVGVAPDTARQRFGLGLFAAVSEHDGLDRRGVQRKERVACCGV